MINFKKVVRIGTTAAYGRPVSVFCNIEMEDGNLSITGVEGPKSNGDAIGSCGQIVMSMDIDVITPAPAWDKAMLSQFVNVWKCWHLNDMNAGTPEQKAELAKHKFPGYPLSHFEWARGVLTAADLQPHNGYSYGSKWLRQEVPAEVVAFLQALPDTDVTPAWV